MFSDNGCETLVDLSMSFSFCCHNYPSLSKYDLVYFSNSLHATNQQGTYYTFSL